MIKRRMSSTNNVQKFIIQRETKFRKKREISFRFIVGQRIKANKSVQAKMEWYIFADSSFILTLWGHSMSGKKQGDGDSLILYIKLISFAHEQRACIWVFSMKKFYEYNMHFCVWKDVRKILKHNKSVTLNLKLYERVKKYLLQTVILWYNKMYTTNISFNFQYNVSLKIKLNWKLNCSVK